MGGAGPTNTVGQTSAMGVLVTRTAQAWIDIQKAKPNWKFLRATLSAYQLIIGQQSYTVATALPAGFGLTSIDKWDKDSCWIYTTTTADRSRLTYMPYSEFRNAFASYPAGKPRFFTEGPGGTILFDRTPDAAYYIELDHFQTPEKLVNATDIPALPEQFHDIIAWKSVMMFAGAEMATDLFAYANSMYKPMLLDLMIDQIDMPTAARSYAIAGARRSTSGRTFEDAR